MGIELIFNATNLNMVAFSQNDIALRGQIFTLFTICIATCETAVALAIILQVYRYFKSTNPDKVSELQF
jgi:NADH:ubiquinone oxidoreductase subunit K